MKKIKIIIVLSICNFLVVKGQDFNIKKNLILENDIYSNFDRNNYAPANFKKLDSIEIAQINKSIKQEKDYLSKIKNAEVFFKKKQYKVASQLFANAIFENKNSGRVDDRIKLACCYSMIGQKDSAFVQLFRIATLGKYINLNEIQSEKKLNNLHGQKEWNEFLNIIIENRKKVIEELNEDLNKK